MRRNYGSYAIFSGPAPCDDPEFADLAFRRRTIAGQSVKRLKLALVERDAECGFQDRPPRVPRWPRKPRRKQRGIVEGVDDGEGRRVHAASPSGALAAFSACLAAMYSAIVGPAGLFFAIFARSIARIRRASDDTRTKASGSTVAPLTTSS